MEPEDKRILEAAKSAAEAAKSYAEIASQSKGEAAKSALAAAKSAEAAAAMNPAARIEDEPEPKGKHLNDYVEDFNYYSGKASEISRSLGLGGIAIIWFFRNSEVGKPLIDKALLYPLIYLVSSLGIDLLQYVLGYLLWMLFYEYELRRWKKKKITDEQIKDLEAPPAIANTLTALFGVKIVLMILAYVKLFVFLWGKIFIGH